jgi:micrococcal nuclease
MLGVSHGLPRHSDAPGPDRRRSCADSGAGGLRAVVPAGPVSARRRSAASSPATRAKRSRAAQQSIPAELIRIIDGDTLEVRALIWLDQHVVTRVRLRGVDAPEIDPRCPEENRRAAAATGALRELLSGRPLHLTDIGRDKFGGRVVARVIAGAAGDVGEAMLAAGHARPYAGGRRERRCA